MNLAIALFLTASGAAQASGDDASMRDQILQAARTEARASVIILQPEVIDLDAMQARGERAKLRRDERGTLWLEFS